MGTLYGHIILLLNVIVGQEMFFKFDFQEKITSFACLFGSGLNSIFHGSAHWSIFSVNNFLSG